MRQLRLAARIAERQNTDNQGLHHHAAAATLPPPHAVFNGASDLMDNMTAVSHDGLTPISYAFTRDMSATVRRVGISTNTLHRVVPSGAGRLSRQVWCSTSSAAV